MELLYFFGLLIILAKSDAAITWTTPTVGGTAACPTMGTVAEGTTTGNLVTISVSSGTTGLTTAVVDTNNFELTGDVVSIKSTATLDFESGASVDVKIEADDDDGTAATATCTIALTDVGAPWFNSYVSKMILPASTPSATALGTLDCTDGATTTSTTVAIESGDDATAKFTVASGALTKSAALFDVATKATYTLTFTCVEGAHTATATMTVCIDKESNCPSSNEATINHGVLAGLIVPTMLAIYHLI